jgi:hypothetical protein
LSRRVPSASMARFGVTLPPLDGGGMGGGGIGRSPGGWAAVDLRGAAGVQAAASE